MHSIASEMISFDIILIFATHNERKQVQVLKKPGTQRPVLYSSRRVHQVSAPPGSPLPSSGLSSVP